MQSDPDLTLERVKTLVRQREAIRDHAAAIPQTKF